MKTCAQCLLPEGKSGIRIDSDGACDLCHYYDTQPDIFPAADERFPQLAQRFDQLKGKYKYDALVGLSGGKDSTFVLYQLVHRYKLKVLAVTFDNGFFTQEARENVNRIVRSLGVDHVYVPAVEPAMKILYKRALKKHGWPCIPCFLSFHFQALNYCTDHQIPFYVTGRSPFQLLRSFRSGTHDPSIELLKINLEPHSFERLYGFYRKLRWFHRLWMLWLFFPHFGAWKTVSSTVLREPKVSAEFSPEILNFFLFEPYDEEAMKSFLEAQNVGYQRPAHDAVLGHGDCYIHEAAAQIYRRKTGTSMSALELAVMLRRKTVSVDEGRQILEQAASPPANLLEDSIQHFCRYFDLSREEFDVLLQKIDSRSYAGFWGH